ncbi:DUF4328 domain-containing protein [Mycobacterium sp. NPDC003449]
MIQVCSQCGTRWNVRDRQRSWCPRCGGTLLAPSASEPQWAAAGSQPGAVSAGSSRTPPRLAPGYRWIAVRPGAAPPPRRPRGPLGPTPRYRMIPSWGLYQPFEPGAENQDTARRGSSASVVRLMLILAMVALGVAVFAHLVRYILLLVNRSVLLHPVIAWGGVLFGLLASLLVLAVVGITVVLLVSWLIARRGEAYAQRGQEDPRGTTELWLCCLLPGVNLAMAPVFVLELATLEGRLTRLRRLIVVWWIVWVLSAVVAVWSIVSTVVVTFFAPNAQNIADNTVAVIVGYLLGLAAMVLAARVFFGFEGATPAERSVHRWVVVGAEQAGEHADEQDGSEESDVAVETQGQNPAA